MSAVHASAGLPRETGAIVPSARPLFLVPVPVPVPVPGPGSAGKIAASQPPSSPSPAGQATLQAPEKEDAAATDWMTPLRRFHLLETQRRWLLQLRATCYGLAGTDVLTLMFFRTASPHHYESILVFVLLSLPLSVLVLPFVLWRKKKVEAARSAMGRFFFEGGVRPEGSRRLLTNSAHPRLVAEL